MVAACLVIATVSWSLGVFGIGVWLYAVTTSRGWPLAAISSAVVPFYLVGALSSMQVGRLIERRGPRPVVVAGALGLAAGVAALGQVREPWQVTAAFLLMGVGYASLSTVALSATLAPWFERHQGRAVSTAMIGASLGGIIGTPLLVALIDALGFATATGVVAGRHAAGPAADRGRRAGAPAGGHRPAARWCRRPGRNRSPHRTRALAGIETVGTGRGAENGRVAQRDRRVRPGAAGPGRLPDPSSDDAGAVARRRRGSVDRGRDRRDRAARPHRTGDLGRPDRHPAHLRGRSSCWRRCPRGTRLRTAGSRRAAAGHDQHRLRSQRRQRDDAVAADRAANSAPHRSDRCMVPRRSSSDSPSPPDPRSSGCCTMPATATGCRSRSRRDWTRSPRPSC